MRYFSPGQTNWC